MTRALLEVEGLQAGYGDVVVIRGVDLHVAEGESIGLVGPNGHGKTTLLRHLSGLGRVMDGRIRFDDNDITNRHPAWIVELGLIHVAQGSTLFPECTVMENLQLGSYPRRAKGSSERALTTVFDLFPKLYQRRAQLCGTLSGGERQMLAISVGVMSNPRLLVLDEPTLGLAPSVKVELLSSIGQIRSHGTQLIVVDGDLPFVLDLTDRWYGIAQGRVSATGRSAEGVSDEALNSLYFGDVTHG